MSFAILCVAVVLLGVSLLITQYTVISERKRLRDLEMFIKRTGGEDWVFQTLQKEIKWNRDQMNLSMDTRFGEMEQCREDIDQTAMNLVDLSTRVAKLGDRSGLAWNSANHEWVPMEPSGADWKTLLDMRKEAE